MAVYTSTRLFDLPALVRLSSLLFLLLFHFPYSITGYRILITTPQHGSHMLDKLVLGETLVRSGHEVYIAVYSRYPKMAEIPKKGIKPLTFQVPSDILIPDTPEFFKMLSYAIFNDVEYDTMVDRFSNMIYSDCTHMMEDKAFMENVRRLKFDLVITEPFIIVPCYTILPAHLNIPFVSFGLMFSAWELRSPSLPSFVSGEVPYDLESIRHQSLFAKLKNLAFFVLFLNMDVISSGRSNTTLIQNYAPQYSDWGEVIRQSQLFLCTLDHHLGGHEPYMPNFKSVAGLTAVPAKPLPADLEKIMQDSGEHGVIIVSFGASAYYLPDIVVSKLLEAFSRVNQTVLARIGVPAGMLVPSNVKVLKWLPQSDILGHPKTKLFITHCGNNGQYEALYHAVPMIGFPLFADQPDNSAKAEAKGISIGMNIRDFTADELVNNIHKVIYTASFKNKIREISERWRDEKFGPRDRAVFWIEHVIKYGGRHLRSPAMELSIYEFLMLDVILIVLVLLTVVAVSAFCIGKLIFRKVFKRYFSSKNDKLKTN